MRAKAEVMAKAYDQDVSHLEEECERYIEVAESLRPYVEDTSLLLWNALREDKRVAARRRPGHHARSGPRHLSLSSPPPTLWPDTRAWAAASGRSSSARSGGSPRRTAPGSAKAPSPRN